LVFTEEIYTGEKMSASDVLKLMKDKEIESLNLT